MTATTWILAADGNQARLLKGVNLLKDGQQNPEQEVFRWEPKKAQDIMADKPGRSHSSVGPGRSAMEYSSDPVREEQQKFTAEVASRIDDYAAEGAFDRLVVCAAPQTLGDLRSKLSDKARTLTTAEIDKNFSNLPTEKLISSVRSIMFDA
ncbi:host attachment protein [Shinella sp. PSBB067]|mgnify:FL=1|uniref:host attachment protein n=1 Tax=unclassified Shinella TaxID=2643062 RepID=UPI00193B2F60|nr:MULTISPECIES: host attachment protein [unclassified Shinella]MBN9056482.1 host attachment protein [Hyphomicrobiales bacterium]QRI65789.1 host attachment protein [Shinella sp. PSBB067]